ncbi:MAG: hypothetical protein FWB87_10795 [Defluviitaleaceae bacterium]|nr:hypothetical protein [Defluviitaleaceae bacterium]MCL2261987.1 hypothetical protein [Defluviitaleaceae bacterium]
MARKSKKIKALISNLIMNTNTAEAQFDIYGLRISSIGYLISEDFNEITIMMDIILSGFFNNDDNYRISIIYFNEKNDVCGETYMYIRGVRFNGFNTYSFTVTSEAIATSAHNVKISIISRKDEILLQREQINNQKANTVRGILNTVASTIMSLIEPLSERINAPFNPVNANLGYFPKYFEIPIICEYNKAYYYFMFLMKDSVLMYRDLTESGSIQYVFRVYDMDIEKLAQFVYYYNKEYPLHFHAGGIQTLSNCINNLHPYFVMKNIYWNVYDQYCENNRGSAFKEFPELIKGTILEQAHTLLLSYEEKIKEHRNHVFKNSISPPVRSEFIKYKLFNTVRILYPDAMYKTRVVQKNDFKIDIFVPSKNFGINFSADEQKKLICKQNSILLLNWKYKQSTAVQLFLRLMSEKGMADVPSYEQAQQSVRQFDVIANRASVFSFLK